MSKCDADTVKMLTLILAVCIPCRKSADGDRLESGTAEPCKLIQNTEKMLVGFRDDHRGDTRLAERVHDELDVAEKRQLAEPEHRAAVVEALAVVMKEVGLRTVLLFEPQLLKICIFSHVRFLQVRYSAGVLPFSSTHYNSFRQR